MINWIKDLWNMNKRLKQLESNYWFVSKTANDAYWAISEEVPKIDEKIKHLDLKVNNNMKGVQ
tara:strand:+ start:360 stop:548 length:189 start_codon:yes stop_codon:yes gene_type:complete